MLSKNTVMAVAIVILREAIQNNKVQENEGDIVECILQGNIYGMFSDMTINDHNAEELHEWYGTEMFELHAGVRYDASLETFEKFKSHVSGSEYVNLSDWGAIDGLLQYTGLTDLSGKECNDRYGFTHSRELVTAPRGLLVNQVLQTINWDELWNDKDFTIDTEDVVYLMESELVTNRREYARVLDINAALKHHGLPPMKDFIRVSYFAQDPAQKSNFDMKTNHSQGFLDLVDSYMESIPDDPREFKSIGYAKL